MMVGASAVTPAELTQPLAQRSAQRATRILFVVFIVSLLFVNPWVRGDGVGYYAFVRALVIDHNLDFRSDWRDANPSFSAGRFDSAGQLRPDQYTATGHVDNHFSIGPAILWAPFVAAAHAFVLIADRLGGAIPADGFSRPYRLAMALATALYGFGALWLGFDLSRHHVDQRWALLATFGIWFASSLPVYMYFNPSWSHALSAFSVALFIWYWQRTRDRRSWTGWILLGLMAGLAVNVYYPTAVVLLFPLLEFLQSLRAGGANRIGRLLAQNGLFAAVTSSALLPTLITKKIIYGSYLNFGYTERWSWNSPAFFRVCFSSEHGLFSWTPILIFAVAGLFLMLRYDRLLALGSVGVILCYIYLIGCYQDWDGLSSFGNRFFVSLTPLFILGLAAMLEETAKCFRQPRGVYAGACAAVGIFVIWNLGFVFQWGLHLVPARGPISWRKMAYNQVAVVPRSSASALHEFLFERRALMQQIEETDQQQQPSQSGNTIE